MQTEGLSLATCEESALEPGTGNLVTAEEAVKVYHDQLKKLGIERCAIWPLTCSLPRR